MKTKSFLIIKSLFSAEYSTLSLTAESSVDFDAVSSGEISFAMDIDEATVDVTIHSDDWVEGTEVFAVYLFYPTDADPTVCTGKIREPSKAYITVRDVGGSGSGGSDSGGSDSGGTGTGGSGSGDSGSGGTGNGDSGSGDSGSGGTGSGDSGSGDNGSGGTGSGDSGGGDSGSEGTGSGDGGSAGGEDSSAGGGGNGEVDGIEMSIKV